MLSLKPLNNSTVFKILQVGFRKILQKVAKCDRTLAVRAQRSRGSQKPGFCHNTALQTTDERKNPVSWILRYRRQMSVKTRFLGWSA